MYCPLPAKVKKHLSVAIHEIESQLSNERGISFFMGAIEPLSQTISEADAKEDGSITTSSINSSS